MDQYPVFAIGRNGKARLRARADLRIAYPREPQKLSDAEWAEYLFARDNPRGPFAERWCHSVGCRRWFNAVRDTATYRFERVYRLDDPKPVTP